MSKFKSDDILKALEHCTSGGNCFDCLMNDKYPQYSKTGCMSKQMYDALSLIKELTEDNVYGLSAKELAEKCENLSIEFEAMRGAANSYKMHNRELTEENERLKANAKSATEILNFKFAYDAGKADTVREMSEMLKDYLDDYYHSGEDELLDVPDMIDLIAKEMLEGE